MELDLTVPNHPLLPTPQAPQAAALAVSSTTGGSPPSGPPKARRAFKACAHCRSRKAKCDLGDLNSPHNPPCSRCRREGVTCEFLPSRRGGRIAYDKQKREKGDQDVSSQEPELRSAKRATSQDQDELESEPEPLPISSANVFIPPLVWAPDSIADHNLSFWQTLAPPVFPPFPPSELGRPALRFPPSRRIPPPSSTSSNLLRNVRPTKGATLASPASDSSPGESHSDGNAARTEGSLPTTIQHRDKRRKKSSALPGDPNSLAAVSLRNPADALDLLLLAADGDTTMEREGRTEDSTSRQKEERRKVLDDGAKAKGRDEGVDEAEQSPGEIEDDSATLEKLSTLADFPLVKKGIVSPQKLYELVDTFISRCHFLFPMIPSSRLPRTEAALAKFASEELHLVTVFVLIASRHDKNPQIHETTWAYFQTLIHDIVLGKCVSVGAVEALLLLSDYLPRQPDVVAGSITAEENRLSWMVVGLAVRLGYMLGLDEKAFAPIPLSASSPGVEPVEDEVLNRERLAWTYCYLFDRQISIRTGKAFWSRGPALCFSGGSAEKNFPLFRSIPQVQDDFASLIQASCRPATTFCIQTDNAPSLLGNPESTFALGESGEYFAHFAHFTRTFEAFRQTWEGKRWATYPLTECVLITYHFLRLYTYGFAMQAHLQRATDNTSDEDDRDLFAGGLMASPDAKFILEAIGAATDLLRLVVDRIAPGGALPYLPWRFFMFTSYAGVFLLKGLYVGVVAPQDRVTIIRLLKKLIVCLAQASTDAQHPGVRYARLLQGLLRVFKRGRASALATQVPTPTRRTSPPPLPNFDFLPPSKDQASQVGENSSASHFPPTFPSYANSARLAPFTSATAFAPSPSNPPPPCTMPPFTESRPIHELATSLEESVADDLFNFDLDLDLGGDAEVVLPAHSEAFSFLLEDSAMDFWASFSAQGDNWLT